MPLSLAQDLPVTEQDGGALVSEEQQEGSTTTLPSIEVETITIPRRGEPPLQVRLFGIHQGLVGHTFEHTDLSGCDFSGMVLAGAKFFDCDLTNTRWDRANCAGVTFDASRLRGAIFTETNLTGTSFEEARIEGARFEGCIIHHSNMRTAQADDNTIINCGNFSDFELPRSYIYSMSRRFYRTPDEMFRQEYRHDTVGGTASSMTATEAAILQRAVRPNPGWSNGSLEAYDWGRNEVAAPSNEVPKKKRDSKPRTYRFGLEFEAYKPDGVKLEYKKSKFGTDGSIRPPEGFRGFEMRTEPLKYQEVSPYLKRLLKYVHKNNCGTNDSCGLHIHASHPQFFNAKYIQKLVFFWISIEDVIMSTQPKGRFNNYYCKRTLFQYINDYGRIIPEEKEELIREMRGKDRYSALNLAALEKHGTIEVRLHEGTLDEEKVVNWAIFMKSIFDHVMDHYNPITTRMLFNQDIDEDKINKVFEVLRLPENVVEFYKNRIKKFGWKRLKKQTEIAKECIAIQKEKLEVARKIEQIDRKLRTRIKMLRGREPEPRSILSGLTANRSLRDVMQDHVNEMTQATPPEGSIMSSNMINEAYNQLHQSIGTSLGEIHPHPSVPEEEVVFTSPRGVYTLGSEPNMSTVLSAGSGA